jgi:hypothetical protein
LIRYVFLPQIIRPPHFAVCNAVGAALCSVSGTIESIVDLLPTSVDGGVQRKLELDRLTLTVQQQCEKNGAHPSTIHLVDIEQVPLTYYPGGYKHRVLLTAIGELDLSKLKECHQQSGGQHLLMEESQDSPQSSKVPKYTVMSNKRPVFDENSAWIIDPVDIEYIAYGVGILGKFVLMQKNMKMIQSCRMRWWWRTLSYKVIVFGNAENRQLQNACNTAI